MTILEDVTTRAGGLVADIQAGALDSGTNLADLLRKCIVLGGETGSQRLREWASKELKGYGPGDEFPPFRQAASPLYLDGSTMSGVITGQQVPYNMIPDVARDRLSEPICIHQSVAELVDIITSHRRNGEDSVKLLPPLAQELVALINHNLAQADRDREPFPGIALPPSQVVERVYWVVGLNVYASVIDTVRTTLVELVAEMKAASPQDAPSPTREAAEQAVEVAVYGKVRRLVVNQVGPHATGAASAAGVASTGNTQPETKSHKIMWWVGGSAGIIAATGAIVALFVH